MYLVFLGSHMRVAQVIDDRHILLIQLKRDGYDEVFLDNGMNITGTTIGKCEQLSEAMNLANKSLEPNQ